VNLHYQIQGQGQTVVLIHGLFGSADNLGLLARTLKEHYQVISLDLRNHGRSPHSEHFTYSDMAQDVVELLNQLDIQNFSVVGHSMGGKVAMALTELAAERIEHLIVLDMAPVAYQVHRHQNVFAGLKAVDEQRITSRKEAEQYLSQHVLEPGVRQFLLKSLHKAQESFQWRFNVDALINNYSTIMGWSAISPFHGRTLFIKGQDSEYILAEHREHIANQFPNAKAHMVANTGHWLHAEKPDTVNRIVLGFLEKDTQPNN